VLDAGKHYWVGPDELEKLLRRGEGWLAQHPEKEFIVNRYLRHKKELTRAALERLVAEEGPDPDTVEATHSREELEIEEPLKLWQRRMAAVISVLKESGAVNVLDLGCGEGRLMRELLEERSFRRITGMDVSFRSLEIAARRLHLEKMSPAKRERVQLLHGSLMYKDVRLAGFDAACVVEVIEHLDPPRLAAFERVLFQQARPGTVIITTPNADYNQKFPTLPAGQFRHKDHRFEWTRHEFRAWAQTIAERFGYSARFLPVGDEDEHLGAPTQMGVFSL
jgi:3' terminal RNA ribose 2'-O-methyltransferase Hen1